MKVGYSLSPGGLLYPYHIGVLTSLTYHDHLTPSHPIAGSSAGAIAVATHAAGIPPSKALEGTLRIASQAQSMGGAPGNLLPLLEHELNDLLPENVAEELNARPGTVGLAHYQLFPTPKPILETYFETKAHVMDSICNSSMFPFFSTKFPCRLAKYSTVQSNGWPRVTVDGFFCVERDRFGCPDFHAISNSKEEGGGDDDDEKPNVVERTITISVVPHESIALTASDAQDQISPLPSLDTTKQMTQLIRLATSSETTRKDYTNLYENGWMDAERWIKEEEERQGRSGSGKKSTTMRRELYGRALLGEEWWKKLMEEEQQLEEKDTFGDWN